MAFKTCSMCRKSWAARDEFLDDTDIELAGYQIDFVDFSRGYFLFNHSADGCGTTIAILVGSMIDLFEGPIFQDSKFGTDKCLGHCLTVTDFDKCYAPCRNARVREVMRIILARKKPKA